MISDRTICRRCQTHTLGRSHVFNCVSALARIFAVTMNPIYDPSSNDDSDPSFLTHALDRWYLDPFPAPKLHVTLRRTLVDILSDISECVRPPE